QRSRAGFAGRRSQIERRPRTGRSESMSDVESDFEDVAVDHLVLLALDPQAARLLGLVPRPQLEQLVPPDDLGPDEPPLQVGVDDAGALGRLGPGAERPGPALLVTGRQEGAAAEEVVGGTGDPRQRALAEAES